MKSERKVQRSTIHEPRKRCALCVALCMILMTPVVFISRSAIASSEGPRMLQRIVSLSTVVTEELFLLGEGKRVVGRSRFCVRPAEVQEIPEAGSIVEINLEKVVSLVPDLVIVTPMIDPRAVAKMKALGLRVETFAPAKNFKGVGDTFLRLAGMIGREAEAAKIIEDETRAVELLRRKVPQGPPISVFLEVGSEPLVTVTRNSFLNDLIEFAGGKNIAADAERPIYSREKVLSQDPDMIIISSMGFDGEKEKRMWEKYPELKAARGNRIVFVNSDLFCSPTPVTFTRALETMIQILHANYPH
ncbi:MAG: helical backbone metal receptor [Candidatus Omnitrophota bacterium]